MRRNPFPFGWSVLLLLATGPALAGPAVPADPPQQARIECAAGNYQAGIRLLAELWVATKDPVWIYNQGRCYEQNNQNEQAIGRFREYLRVAPSLTADEVKAVKQRIEELQQEAHPQLPPTVSPPLPAAAPPATGSVPATASLTGNLPSEAESPKPYYQRWWFWTGIGAVVAGGVVTAILLGSRSAPKSPACDSGALCASP